MVLNLLAYPIFCICVFIIYLWWLCVTREHMAL